MYYVLLFLNIKYNFKATIGFTQLKLYKLYTIEKKVVHI